MLRARLSLGILAASLAAGCVGILGLDELSAIDAEPDGAIADDSSAGLDAAAEGSPPPCSVPSKCLKAPAGWDGPFAVLLGDGLEACTAPFLRSWERVGTMASDASAPPAACTCSCGTRGCAARLVEFDNQSCGGVIAERALALGACVPQTNGADSYRVVAVAQGDCPPDASTTVLPLEAGTLAVGCSPIDPGGCVEGACFPPAPPNARVCVRATLDASSGCPAEFPAEVAIPAGAEDTRGCTPCTCATSTTCAASYRLYTSTNCTGTAITVNDALCQSPLEIESIQLAAASSPCTPAGGTATGGVTVTSDSTLCCLP